LDKNLAILKIYGNENIDLPDQTMAMSLHVFLRNMSFPTR